MKQKNQREICNATFVFAAAALVMVLVLVGIVTGLTIKVKLDKRFV